MDDEDVSVSDFDPTFDVETVSPGNTTFDKQVASLQTYLGSVPYECESIEAMNAKLEYIVGRIAICAQARNWLVLTTWDGMLQCWLLMRYPVATPTRAKLVRLYYELCLVPGIEPRVVRSWADMLARLLSNKPDQRRKLEPSDIQLPWQPLWRVLQKELWPKKRLQDTSRNIINILLFVAEQCKRYYPSDEIPSMLSTFLPHVTADTILTMIPVMVSFLPPTNIHLYVAPLFKLWEAFNSSLIDDRLLELSGDLSEEHVASQFGDAGEGGAVWKDVGIWNEAEWSLLMSNALGSMNVPVGSMRQGATTTSAHADIMGDRQSLRIKKSINRYSALAKILIYSMSLDGPIRDDNHTPGNASSTHVQSDGFLAGSKALDSLDKLITSTESFFHPSNSGPWTLALTNFIQRLTAEFCKRWKEEEQSYCKTPVTRRLTPAIRRTFVTTLRTPALLAMFSKDPISMSCAQGALRAMALLEPKLIMPELLDRAYSGLEGVNETHRTTAVMTMLSGIALPLVSENIWLGGQKHLVPLLELCIPGIDLNDPIKTLCASLFIASAVQHIKIGDLSQAGVPLSGDDPVDEMMDVDHDNDRMPEGMEIGTSQVLSREEERALVRDSTAGFADWVTSLFRRVLALYENLPEEGGKKNTTGGKMEENVLKSIKSMLDVVCLHLSDPLFDLILKLVFEYATTNVKSNAVRAFGGLVASLARVKPEITIAKFLPFCVAQIQEELKHGASSVRTTFTHAAIPSDTTLHWNLSILRGCLGYGGAVLLKYKQQLLELMTLLIDKTKNERGYSSTGRLIDRILHTLAGVYPIETRFVNPEEWDDPVFNGSHNLHWGRMYDLQDVKIDWHVPSTEEIDFVIEILENVAAPNLDRVESLLETSGTWDNVARNDFCRYLYAVRSTWSALPTFCQESIKVTDAPCFYEDIEVEGLLVTPMEVQAGFALTDPQDSRYQKVASARTRFGNVIHRAAVVLGQKHEGEDHIDAVIGISKAIDVILLEYAMTRGNFDSLQKAYGQARDQNRMWPKQKFNSRTVFLKRAQVYHAGRVYMHALYRRRSELNNRLLGDLVELSLSPYTRVRRHAQAVLHNACGYYVRSTRFILPSVFRALAKGSDPDRMKGALYLLWNKGTASYALADPNFHSQYLLALLDCQHQEKPSIQKLVGNLSQDALVYLTEEATHTDAYTEDVPGVISALDDLKGEFSAEFGDEGLLAQAMQKLHIRARLKNERYADTVSSILVFATKPTTHWRYVQTASRFLHGLLRRDFPVSVDVAKFFIQHSISPHTTNRVYAQKAVIRLLSHIKIRTFSKSSDEMWLDEWSNPLQRSVPVHDPSEFLKDLHRPIRRNGSDEELFVDKLNTGFVVWAPVVKAYVSVGVGESPFAWESSTALARKAMLDIITEASFFTDLALLWGQETSRNTATLDVRTENVIFMTALAKMFEHHILEPVLTILEPLLLDSDRFKQRAGAEFLAGLMRGSKHWPKQRVDELWVWTSPRLERVYSQIKPDTLALWEGVFNEQLLDRDPRRTPQLVEWILSLPLEFHGDSAFAMTKALTFFNIVVDCAGFWFMPLADRYINLFFENANTGYAEIREHIAQNLFMIITSQWRPFYPSVNAFLQSCQSDLDPLRIRDAKHIDRVLDIATKLPKWKEERLPAPRVSQSQYDKVGLTMLQLVWTFAHSPQAALVFPYVTALLPEILRMSELNDSSELQTYSAAVLYVLSAVNPPPEYVAVIADNLVDAIKSSTSWRIRVNALPTLIMFFYRNLLSLTSDTVAKVMEVLLDCLADENVEVRERAWKMLSGVIRCSQRQSIVPLKNRFLQLAKNTRLPSRRDPAYADSLRILHSAILGLCALIESTPYSVEPWMPPLTDVLALHATDPPPISTTIRRCASEFKKTHQDTWQKDQLAFDEDQLQSLSTMLVGTSYYA